MGIVRAANAGLTAAQVMEFWLWLWLGFAERELARGKRSAAPGSAEIAAELTAELASLETISARLSAELPDPKPDLAAGRTFARLLERLPGAQPAGLVLVRRDDVGLAAAEGAEPRHLTARFLGRPVAADASRLGATLVDADLGEELAWRAVITPRGFDEAAEFSAAGAIAYELYLLVGADGALKAIHQRIDRSPHGRRWFTPVPAPGWLHPQGRTLDVAWSDLAGPARARMLALLSALTSGATAPSTTARLPDQALAVAARRARRSRH
jgi:hypothetical protein